MSEPRRPYSTFTRPRRIGKHRQRAYGVQVRGEPCAFCGESAVNADHVIPRSLVRKYNATAPEGAPSIPAVWLAVVPACFSCNILKGSRRLVPVSWEKRVKKMNAFFGGTPFRVWHGGTDEQAYREAWR